MPSYRTLHPRLVLLAAVPILLMFGRMASAHPDGQEGPQAAAIPLRQVALHEAFEHVAEVWRASQRGDATQEWADEYRAGVYEAFENLARAGCVEAAATCLRDHRALRRRSADEALPPIELEYRVGMYEGLLDAADPAGMGLALELLRNEQELSSGQIEALVRALTQRRLVPLDVQAQARLDLARLLASWSSTDEGHGSRRSARWAEAQALYGSIQEEFVGTEYADRASSASWRLEHLSPGRLAPDFLTHDLAGNEIRLSDFIGQVVVVHFTDPASADSRQALDRSEVKGRRHWDSRFVWVGIHRGGNSSALEAALDDSLTCGEHAWEGAGVAGAAQTWRIPARDSLWVIDPAGLVSAMDPAGSLLDRHITNLLGDLQQQGRMRQAESGGDGDQADRGSGGGPDRALREQALPSGRGAQGDEAGSRENQTP